MNAKTEYYNKQTLKARGWTEGWIQRFLGEPDATVKNPIYASAAPMQLYAQQRVHAIEDTEAYQEEFVRAAPRRERQRQKMLQYTTYKREEVQKYIDGLRIKIPLIPWNKLREAACLQYNALWADRGCYDKCATVNDDPAFLDRITVNFLRHNCSHYDAQIVQLFGQIGKQEGIMRMKFRVLNEIAQVYPALRDECDRQWAAASAERH